MASPVLNSTSAVQTSSAVGDSDDPDGDASMSLVRCRQPVGSRLNRHARVAASKPTDPPALIGPRQVPAGWASSRSQVGHVSRRRPVSHRATGVVIPGEDDRCRIPASRCSLTSAPKPESRCGSASNEITSAQAAMHALQHAWTSASLAAPTAVLTGRLTLPGNSRHTQQGTYASRSRRSTTAGGSDQVIQGPFSGGITSWRSWSKQSAQLFTTWRSGLGTVGIKTPDLACPARTGRPRCDIRRDVGRVSPVTVQAVSISHAHTRGWVCVARTPVWRIPVIVVEAGVIRPVVD